MSMKILSPAGDIESLKAAVYNGADEIYLGISGFNARNNITGFTLETLPEAINFAHLYNVKVHLAINILFSNDELKDAVSTIVKAYNLGVDAFIIQDLGLASILKTNYPEIILHASTQMGICNLEGVKYISKLGFKRVVLARETPIEEIKRIKQHSNIEIEYFAQGALCVSFSGNCYLSSYVCNASGNRGKCKQLCRLPYTLKFENKKLKTGYLLSAKDFNMLNKLQDLDDAGVDAIKIEGRARRPFYVATATNLYHKAINNLPFNKKDIELAFNRLYTPGYFNGNSNIISPYKSHIGEKVGKIIKINTGNKFNEIIFSSNKPLSQKSTLKVFQNKEEITTFTAYTIKHVKGNTYSTTTTQKIPANGDLHLIIDEDVEKNTLAITRKIPVSINIQLQENQPISAKLSTRDHTLTIRGDICQAAKSRPLSQEEIIESFNKSAYFEPRIDISTQNAFLTKQQLNSFRRLCYDSLYNELITNNKKPLLEKKLNVPKLKQSPLTNFSIIENLSVLPSTKNIIFSPETYNLKEIEQFLDLCKSQNKTPILDTPNFLLEKDIQFFKEIVSRTNITLVANNYAALLISENSIAGAGLNIYNHVSSNFINKPFLTAEEDFGSKIAYPYMTLRHCPMKEHLNASCSNCPYRPGYSYQMQNGQNLVLKRKKISTCTFYLTKE